MSFTATIRISIKCQWFTGDKSVLDKIARNFVTNVWLLPELLTD